MVEDMLKTKFVFNTDNNKVLGIRGVQKVKYAADVSDNNGFTMI